MFGLHLIRDALRRPWTVLVTVIAALMFAWAAFERVARDVLPSLGMPTVLS